MIIGITGLKQSGKDTAAAILVTNGWKLVKFADGLKEMMKALYRSTGMDEVQIELMVDGSLKELPNDLLDGKTTRYAMQTLGTEWGRQLISENLWINICKAKCQTGNIVISDVRFPNEVQLVKDLDGVVIKLIRSYHTRVDSHASEKLIKDLPYDHLIVNNSTIEHLQNKILEISKKYYE